MLRYRDTSLGLSLANDSNARLEQFDTRRIPANAHVYYLVDVPT